MDDAFSQGRPFVLDKIWRPSCFGLDESPGALIATKLTDPSQLEFRDGGLRLQDQELPAIGKPGEHAGNDVNRSDVSQPSSLDLPSLSEPSDTDSEPDLWSLDFGLADTKPQHQTHTWETFEKRADSTARQTAYLSEAGPEAYSAALHLSKYAHRRFGVLPQNATLRAMCNVVIGRSSDLFQWDVEKAAFIRVLSDVPICGLSPITSSSVISRMTVAGSMFRNLRTLVSNHDRFDSSCTAMIALKGCIIDILDDLESNLLTHTHKCRSILQLQRALDRPYEVLTLLLNITQILQDQDSDESIISMVSDFVHRQTAGGSHFAGLLKSLLSRTSGPWLERLQQDVGLESAFVALDADSSTQDLTDGVDLDVSLQNRPVDTDQMPSFVSDDDRALIALTKANVEAVRLHLPGRQSGSSQQVAIWNSREDSFAAPNDALQIAHGQNLASAAKAEDSMAWADQIRQEEWLSSLHARMSEPLRVSLVPSNYLRSALDDDLAESASSSEHGSIYGIMHLDPLEQLRPAMTAHKRRLNKILLRHVFNDLRFRQQLDLHRQYHFLGNGDFVARLCQALFSADTQTAERRRGVVPSSHAMGLRLDTREGQRWPPASSELRLTLAGVLTETYHCDPTHSIYKVAKELPGGLSFSIRELPDEEIERVMDVDSIYALDFLRLHYTAPSCLGMIFTAMAMKTYDDIFKFLIRLLRVQHVAAKLRERLVLHAVSRQLGKSDGHDARVQYALETHNAVSILFTHFMDVGIEASWRDYALSLANVERVLMTTSGADEPSSGLDDLRARHDFYLERVRSRLFLRRKWEKPRKAVDGLLISVLAGALAADKEQGDTLDSRPFKQALNEICEVLTDAIERPRRMTTYNEADESDAEAMKILLMRLR